MNFKIGVTIAVLVATLSGCKSNSVANINIDKYFSWNDSVKSFRAESELYGHDDKLSGKTIFKFQDPDRWEMSIDDKNVRANWKGIAGEVYVKDFNDQKWWQGVDKDVSFTSRVDFRKFVEYAKNNDEIAYSFKRKEKCSNTDLDCYMYLVIDPAYSSGRENINQTLWLTTEGKIFKEEYQGDTGKTVTFYSEFNQVKISIPKNVKPIGHDDNVFLLDGSWINPLDRNGHKQ